MGQNNVPVHKTTTYSTFSYATHVRPDGVKVLVLTSMDGHRQEFPFTKENAALLSSQMAENPANVLVDPSRN